MTDKTAGEALLTLVGETPTDGKAAAERVQRCLRKAGIKTLNASSDGVNVHASVKASVQNAALCAIHREFFENAPESVINLYVAGYGAVGKAFEELLKERSLKFEATDLALLCQQSVEKFKTYAAADITALETALGGHSDSRIVGIAENYTPDTASYIVK